MLNRFNPRPRAGGDPDSGKLYVQWHVSIHAPARGATHAARQAGRPETLFQSTPPRGGRRVGAVVVDRGGEFQSTPPRGGRLDVTAERVIALVFQSTPPRGGRQVRSPQLILILAFQSTPPRGGRPVSLRRGAGMKPVSIHAPARGATLGDYRGMAKCYSFNPRPRAGGDRAFAGDVCLADCFNPRPRAGGDLSADKWIESAQKFQSTPPRGGRRR